MQNLNLINSLNKYDIQSVSDFVRFVYEILDPKTTNLYQNPKFHFDMMIFSDKNPERNVCIGCMATAAIIEITETPVEQYHDLRLNQDCYNKEFNTKEHYYRFYLEHAINNLRTLNFASMCDDLREIMYKNIIWPNFNLSTLDTVIANNVVIEKHCKANGIDMIQTKKQLKEMYDERNRIEKLINIIKKYEQNEC